MSRFRNGPSLSAWVGIAIVTALIAVAILAPWIAPYSESESPGPTWQEPSVAFLLGTDSIGRDMLTRVIYGARLTLSIALVTTVLSFLIGITAGLLAAVGGSTIDQILSRLVDVILSIPLLIFALVILSMLGGSLAVLVLTIAVLDSTRVFRLARSVAQGIVVQEFVEAARLRGEGLAWIIRREILPNALPPLISEFGLRFCFNFLFIAGLSFLGMGVQPPYADWGGMVKDNAGAIFNKSGSAPLWPAAAIALMTVGVNLIVDWVLSRNARPSGASAEM